ncbi:MAG: DUF4430 domain-containing protein [bacterium]|nr:DUF4430 domain-containing protein [bacterium]
MKFDSKKLTNILILAALVVGALVFLWYRGIAPDLRERVGQNTGLVDISFDFGEGNVLIVEDVNFTEGTDLFEFTEQIARASDLAFDFEDYGDLGILITTIGPKENGQDGGKYWQYLVNGEYAQVGASMYILQEGDEVEWLFTSDEQE